MKLINKVILFFILILTFSITGMTQAISIDVQPATSPQLPVGGIQSINAWVSNVNDKTVTWSTTGGTLIGVNPCTISPCSIGLYSSTTGTFTVTATSNDNSSISATSVVTFVNAPTPRTDWPRFMVNQDNLAATRTKATGTNTPWNDLLNGYPSGLITQFPGIDSGWSWTCNSGTGQPNTPQYNAYLLIAASAYAYGGLLDPSNSTYHWSCYAHDIAVYFWKNILNGNIAPAENDWSNPSVENVLTGDFLLGTDSLSGGSGATATVTLSGSTLNTPVVNSGGTGYKVSSTIEWDALAGTSGCTVIGDIYGRPTVAKGSVSVNSSGVVNGTMTITTNATGCTSAPTIVFFTEKNLLRAYLMHMAQIAASYAGYPNGDTTTQNSAALYTQANTGIVRQTGVNNANYMQSVMLYMVAAGLEFNDNTADSPTDDIITPNTCGATRYQVCSDFSAGSSRAYWNFFTGTYLLEWWTHSEDAAITQPALNTFFPSNGFGTVPMCPGLNSTPTICFGDGVGGEAAEGSGYGYSLYRSRFALNAIISSGNANPSVWGPQISAAYSAYWDSKIIADREFNTTWSVGNQWTWSYQHSGDTNSYSHKVFDALADSAMLDYDTIIGRTDNLSALEWLTYNYAPGGPDGSQGGCTQYCGIHYQLGNYNFSQSMVFDVIFSTPAIDPLSALPADPLSTMPFEYYNRSYNQHQIVRTGTGSTSPVFTTYWPNTLLNHEHQFAGAFDIAQNNEYITTHRTVFDNNYNYYMSTQPMANGMSIFNSTGTSCYANDPDCWHWKAFISGGQPGNGSQFGLQPVLKHSELPTYAAAINDTTNDFNGGAPYLDYNDVLAASRSLVYLIPTNQIVIYDRAQVGHTASLQSTYMNTTGTPTVSGNTATWLTRSGTQKAAYTNLLPVGASLTKIPLVNLVTTSAPFSSLHLGSTMQAACIGTNGDNSTEDLSSDPQTYWDTDNHSVATVSSSGLITPISIGGVTIYCSYQGNGASGYMQVISGASTGSWTNIPAGSDQTGDWELASALKVTPSGTPLSSQFLNVLEWGSSSFTKTSTNLVQSSSGQHFDGALIGSSIVMFMKTPTSLLGTTYPASGATTHYIADLTPNTTYTVTGTGAPGSVITDSAGVLKFSAAGTGDITIGAITPTPGSPTFSPGANTYTSIQSVTLAIPSIPSSPGSFICYNTSGAPSIGGGSTCTNGTLYTSPITVGVSETIYAVAGGVGYNDSSISSAAYVINLPPVPAIQLIGPFQLFGPFGTQ